MEKRIEYKMIDLGLPSGLKWADRNVGAASPEAIGDYFMYGSTTPDTDKPCDWAHAPFNNGSEKFDDVYFNGNKPEWLTEDCTLKPEYDAAHAIMGESWRMPMPTEMRELLDGTNRSVEGNGMRFTSKTNGNSIFIPFCGYRGGSDAISVGNLGNAWSSTLNADYADYSLSIGFDKWGYANIDDCYRYCGFAVRGVCK